MCVPPQTFFSLVCLIPVFQVISRRSRPKARCYFFSFLISHIQFINKFYWLSLQNTLQFCPLSSNFSSTNLVSSLTWGALGGPFSPALPWPLLCPSCHSLAHNPAGAALYATLASVLLLWVEMLCPHTPDAASLLFRIRCKCHLSWWLPAHRVQNEHSSYPKTHLYIVFPSSVYHFLNIHAFASYPFIHQNVSSMEAEKKPGIVHTHL